MLLLKPCARSFVMLLNGWQARNTLPSASHLSPMSVYSTRLPISVVLTNPLVSSMKPLTLAKQNYKNILSTRHPSLSTITLLSVRLQRYRHLPRPLIAYIHQLVLDPRFMGITFDLRTNFFPPQWVTLSRARFINILKTQYNDPSTPSPMASPPSPPLAPLQSKSKLKSSNLFRDPNTACNQAYSTP